MSHQLLTQGLAAMCVPLFWLVLKLGRLVYLSILLWLVRLYCPRAERLLFMNASDALRELLHLPPRREVKVPVVGTWTPPVPTYLTRERQRRQGH